MPDNKFGSPADRKFIKLNKKFWIIAVSILVVAVLGVSSWLYQNRSKPELELSVEEKVLISNNAFDSALARAEGGDYEGGQSVLDELTKTAKTDRDRAFVYLQKFSVAFNVGNYEDA